MFIFGDESGDFKFRRATNVGRYFVLCTVRMDTCDVGHAILDLRRSMKRRRTAVGDEFHATSDSNEVRTEVFNLLKTFKFDIDATLLDKPKAEPQTRPDEATFYKYTWYYHAKFLSKKVFPKSNDIYLCAAALETRVGRASFRSAFHEVFAQTAPHPNFVLDFPFAVSDPCLQIADYCAWAIGRKWNRGRTDYYEHIQKFIRSEFDLWRNGTTTYY
jgi:hypothetical protein